MSDHESISVKVVIMGEPAVGKTSLRINFVGTEMKGDYMMTLGADLAEKKIEMSDRVTLDTQIWDLAGQENFDPLTRQFLRGTQGAIVVFDLTRDYTFDKVNMWLEKLHEENRNMDNNIPFVIVGNKEDLDSFIKVNDEDVMTFVEYVNRHNIFSKSNTEYIKTSAKTGSRVAEAFKRLGEIMVRNFEVLEGREILGKTEIVSEIVSEEVDTTVAENLSVEEEASDEEVPEESDFVTEQTVKPSELLARQYEPSSIEPVVTETPEETRSVAPPVAGISDEAVPKTPEEAPSMVPPVATISDEPVVKKMAKEIPTPRRPEETRSVAPPVASISDQAVPKTPEETPSMVPPVATISDEPVVEETPKETPSVAPPVATISDELIVEETPSMAAPVASISDEPLVEETQKEAPSMAPPVATISDEPPVEETPEETPSMAPPVATISDEPAPKMPEETPSMAPPVATISDGPVVEETSEEAPSMAPPVATISDGPVVEETSEEAPSIVPPVATISDEPVVEETPDLVTAIEEIEIEAEKSNFAYEEPIEEEMSDSQPAIIEEVISEPKIETPPEGEIAEAAGEDDVSKDPDELEMVKPEYQETESDVQTAAERHSQLDEKPASDEITIDQNAATVNGSVGQALETDPPRPAIFDTINGETTATGDKQKEIPQKVSSIQEEGKIPTKDVVVNGDRKTDREITKEVDQSKEKPKKKKGFIRRIFRI